MTIVLNLETGEILHVGDGKGSDAIKSFLVRLSIKADLKAVAMDMSIPFRSAFNEVFRRGDVDLVHDPFHVVSLVNKAVDDTRRSMFRKLEGDARASLKGTRFILLKGMERLSTSGMERLIKLMHVNKPLYQAYLLKEDFRSFWSLPRSEAKPFLLDWLKSASDSNLPHFKKLAKTLERNMVGLLNYSKHRISTGPLEGINNKIKVLKRQAYGFRDEEYFRLLLFHLHRVKPKLILG